MAYTALAEISIEKYMKWARGLREYIRIHDPDPAWGPLAGWTDEMIADEMRRSGETTPTKAGRHMSRLIRGIDQ